MSSEIVISRRSVLRAAGLSGLGVAAGIRIAGAATTATAFALCGDESHNSDYIRAGLIQLKRRVHNEVANRRRIRLRRASAEGLNVPKGTIAEGTNESRRRVAR